jgi:hypothetical protein
MGEMAGSCKVFFTIVFFGVGFAAWVTRHRFTSRLHGIGWDRITWSRGVFDSFLVNQPTVTIYLLPQATFSGLNSHVQGGVDAIGWERV